MDLFYHLNPQLRPQPPSRAPSPPAEIIDLGEIKKANRRQKIKHSTYEYDPELTPEENYINEALETDRLTVAKLRQMTKDLLL